MRVYTAYGQNRQLAIAEVVTELKASGMDDTEIAARLNDMGFITLQGIAWTAASLKDVEEWQSIGENK